MTNPTTAAEMREAAKDALLHGIGAMKIGPGEVVYVPVSDLLAKPPHDAVERFADWFRKNYPGPDTIIHNPDWHAPRIFRAAIAAMRDAQ